ncbi:MAG: hypothetical protein Kow0059_21320 [Candidatus Sumerlaeia bacterium]
MSDDGPSLERRPRPGRLKLAAFSAAVLLAVLVFVELGARWGLGARPLEAIAGNPYSATPLEMEWVLKPDFEGPWPLDPALSVTIRTNSLGLRDDPIPPKPSGERRILFLGDSVVFGTRLAQHDTLPEQLERRLGAGVRVINAGVEGYSTFQQYHQLRHIGLGTEPDFILLGFVWNDVYEQYRTMRRFGGDGNFMGLAHEQMLAGAERWLFRSAAYTAAKLWWVKHRKRGRAGYAAAGLNYDVSEIFKDPPAPHIAKAWDDTLAQLGALRDLAAEHHVPLLVVVFPYEMQFSPTLPDALVPNRRVRAFCREHSIACYDLFDDFAAAPNRRELFLPGDGTHLSAAGAGFVAGRLAALFEKADLLEQTPDTVFNRLNDAIRDFSPPSK